MLIFLPDRGTNVCIGAPPPPGAKQAGETEFLDPATLRWRRRGSRLEIARDGSEEWQEVTCARLFPHTLPEQWISVSGGFGREVGILQNLEDLAEADRQLVREELSRYYVVPRIERIVGRRRRFDMVQWTADTTSGRITFITRHLRDQVQRPFPEHLIIIDVEGNRFDIPDLGALDAASRAMLEEEL